MTRREEWTMLAMAVAILFAGALIGAASAVAARHAGTPTTSARLIGCGVGEDCPVSP